MLEICRVERSAWQRLRVSSFVLLLVLLGDTSHGETTSFGRLHNVRTPVEFHLNGKLNGIGYLEFKITAELRQSEYGIDGENIAFIDYIFFTKSLGDRVAPYMHTLGVDAMKRLDDETVVFSGRSDYGFPISGRIEGFGQWYDRRTKVNVEGRSHLLIQDLQSREAFEFMKHYIPKVDLGMITKWPKEPTGDTGRAKPEDTPAAMADRNDGSTTAPNAHPLAEPAGENHTDGEEAPTKHKSIEALFQQKR